MKRSLILAVVMAASLLVGQKSSEPALKETLEWMDNTFNNGHRGLFQQWDFKDKLAEEYLYSFTFEHCNYDNHDKCAGRC